VLKRRVFGDDGQSVDGKWHEILDAIIHKPVTCNGGQAVKLVSPDMDAEVTGTIAATSMACVQMRLVDNIEMAGVERL
jgi:hypothetical protein